MLSLVASAAFVPSPPLPIRWRGHGWRVAATACADAADDEDKPLPGDEASDLFASLRARQAALDEGLEVRWKKAQCESRVCFVLDNWVRRISMDWPRCAVGSAEGGVYVADLTTGDVLAQALRAHPSRVPGPAAESDMRMLHGDFDGGGLTAIAIRGERLVTAGRDGNCMLWRVGAASTEVEELTPVAELSTGASIVSTVVLTEDELWCASLDGHVRRFEEDPAGGFHGCSLDLKAASSCLSLAVCEEESLVAVGTADGGVELFSTSDGSTRGMWRPLAADSAGRDADARTRSVAIAKVQGQRCVVAGGSDGTLHIRYLATSASGLCFDDAEMGEPMLPAHGGACVALTPIDSVRDGGLLVSGAHDGTLRVWDLADGRVDGIPSASGPKCLYGLGGYKVWLGSVCTDGSRLVSDGRDNAIVVHDFGEEPSWDKLKD